MSRHPPYTERECVRALQAYYQEHGHWPRHEDWHHGGYRPGTSVVKRRFGGSWTAALRVAGAPEHYLISREGETSMEDRVEWLRALLPEIGRDGWSMHEINAAAVRAGMASNCQAAVAHLIERGQLERIGGHSRRRYRPMTLRSRGEGG